MKPRYSDMGHMHFNHSAEHMVLCLLSLLDVEKRKGCTSNK